MIKFANVAKPGVIVSTIVNLVDKQAQTIVFRKSDVHPGFTTEVHYSEPTKARATRLDLLAAAR